MDNREKKRWTDEEDFKLIELVCTKIPTMELSVLFGRSSLAIKARMLYLKWLWENSQLYEMYDWLLDDTGGELNESLWLYNLVDLYNHYGKNTKEQEEDKNDK